MEIRNHDLKKESINTQRVRSKIEICAKILEVAKNGSKKTHLAYDAELNFNKLIECLEQLLESGLIVGPIGEKGVYKTTEKGIKNLNSFKQISKFLESDK